MINISFNLRNPFSSRWRCLYTRAGDTPFKNKFWEVQVDETSDIFSFDFRFTIRQDHAGVYASLGLLGYDVIFNIYDSRHWNEEAGRYYIYGGDEGPI